jgi:anti-sigma B factor antagonist
MTVVYLSGEIDAALERYMDSARRTAVDRDLPVRVDLSAVTFIDSAGLGFLARVAAAGHAGGWVPAVIGASRLVRETIEMSGLLPVLNLTDPA